MTSKSSLLDALELEVANGSVRVGLDHGSNGFWVERVIGQMGHALRMGQTGHGSSGSGRVDPLNYERIVTDLAINNEGLPPYLSHLGGLVSILRPIFDDALSVFNTSMEIDLLSNPSEIAAPKIMKKLTDIYFTRVTKNAESTFSLAPRQMALWTSQREDHTSDWLRTVSISGLGQTTNSCSRVFAGDIYGDNAVSCVGIIGIKHHHNVVRDNLVNICYRYEISAGKEVDIGLDGGRDKPLRPADMLLYSWDGGLDVCVDLTGSSSLTQTRMIDFIAGWIVIDVSQRKRGKYMAKCAAIGYGFLPFSFSSLEESEADAVTLLKRIRKFSMTQDIGARKVKEFASLTNLKVVLGKEGYANIELKYVGDERVIWVEVKGVPCKWWSRNTFSRIASRWGTLLNGKELEEEGYHSNRICIRRKLNTAVFDYFKMVYRGMTCRVRAIEVPGWVPDFEEDGKEGYNVNDGLHEDDMYGGVSENLKDVEGESEREEVPETNFEEVPDKSIFEGNSVKQNDIHSEDPFGIYEVFNIKRDGKNIDDKHEDSLKYPPGFTPNKEGDVPVEKVDNWSDKNRLNNGQEDGVCVGQHVDERVKVSNDKHESTCFGNFKKSNIPRKGGSILELIDDLVNVGQTMGYDMTGCIKNIEEIIESQGGCEVIMGDFNEVHDISERFGSIFNKHGAEAFNSFIVNAGLVEAPLGECSFTWCHKSAKKMSKLDRFLISDNLMCSCPSISSTSLDRFLSDHRLIIMREAHFDYGPIPFKFFYYWFELDGFDKLVEQTWLEANVNDQNSYSKFMNKLKYLKEKIRIWVRLHKENLNSRKSILKAELASLDGVIDKGEGSDADGHRRRESIEGDENSKYYHGVLNRKRGRLPIRGVLVDGIWIESPHLVKHEFFEHFKNRFEKPNKSRILLERDFVKRTSLEQNDDLEREVSNEKIKRAVWDCSIDKALGPDGFTFGFYRRYWDIIGNDVVDAVKWFFCMERSRKDVTRLFITSILKVPNANMVKDFRPISLIGSLYKVIAKVLANRLVTVIDDIVDEIQSAFETDRQILDGPFILNEIVYWCKNKKKQSMIFKVDFKKAYDSVRWDFIDDILRRFEIMGCLFNLTCAINGRVVSKECSLKSSASLPSESEDTTTFSLLLLTFGIMVLIKHPGRMVLHLVSIDGIGTLLVTMLLMLSNGFFAWRDPERRWDFIDDILRRFGFGEKWLQTPGSGISILLTVGTTFTSSGNLYCQWELSPSSKTTGTNKGAIVTQRLLSEDERTESEKETTESGKNDEDTHEEEHADDEKQKDKYVHDDEQMNDDVKKQNLMNVDIKDPTSDEESDATPARRPTGRRRQTEVTFRDTSNVLKKKTLTQSQKIKGMEILSDAATLDDETSKAIKASRQSEKETTESGKNDEDTNEEEHADDEKQKDKYVHDDEQMNDDVKKQNLVNVDIKDL
nr:putative RNA-directed DNA polymerase, eukaryota, reverse transcriptase zinc-binding domain protein [Tanacetum cinerariifolium]